MGYYHPCSSNLDKKNNSRKKVARECRSVAVINKSSNVVKVPAIIDYSKAINCSDTEPSMLTKLGNSAPNIYGHMSYLYISFAQAADIIHLFYKSVLSTKTKEIGRAVKSVPALRIKEGDTEIRVIKMKGDNGPGGYIDVFADLKKLESKIHGTSVPEDTEDTPIVFMDLLNNGVTNMTVTFAKTNTKDKNSTVVPFPKSTPDIDLKDMDPMYDKLLEQKEMPVQKEMPAPTTQPIPIHQRIGKSMNHHISNISNIGNYFTKKTAAKGGRRNKKKTRKQKNKKIKNNNTKRQKDKIL